MGVYILTWKEVRNTELEDRSEELTHNSVQRDKSQKIWELF